MEAKTIMIIKVENPLSEKETEEILNKIKEIGLEAILISEAKIDIISFDSNIKHISI